MIKKQFVNSQSRNPNTSKLWDKLLVEKNKELLRSPFYIDKIRRVSAFVLSKRGRFLDIGFGSANLEKEILKESDKIEIFRIDISRRAVSNARKKN